MKILITNLFIAKYTGTETYVRELAIELKKKGHKVEIFTFFMGELAEELLKKGIHVTTDLKKITFIPDIIHAHHNIVTMDVLSYFKRTPAIYFIHDRTTDFDIPYLHKNILQYVAVDYNCKERYCLEHNFKDNDVEVIFNWANTERFKLRKTINETPKKGLVFSNYLNETLVYPNIKEACNELGIELEIVGYSSGNFCLKPEEILPNYDLVFGKAKAAIEAIATGAGVIVCDFRGLGGMVTSENLNFFRDFNFGMKLMKIEPTKENLIVEIEKYNPNSIRKVSDFIILESSLDKIISHLELRYSEIIKDYKNKKRGKYKMPFFNKSEIAIFKELKSIHVTNPETRLKL